MASESPTRIMSTPASSATRADGASYAVTMTRGGPSPLRARTSGALIGPFGATISGPPPSGAPTAPGSTPEVSSDRVAAAEEVATVEVVPRAVEADLDHVARELVVGRAQLGELGFARDAPAVRGLELLAVHVRHQ